MHFRHRQTDRQTDTDNKREMYILHLALKKLSSIDDPCQIDSDRVSTPTRAVLCRWSRPHHAACLAALARS